MNTPQPLICLLLFPGGLFLIFASLIYDWLDRKLVARFQNRMGPRWFQTIADMVKLLSKEEVIPHGINRGMFLTLPIVAFTCVMTASLYVPLFGFRPSYNLRGDVIITIYLLSAMTMCLGLAGASSKDRFAVVGATRSLTQLFCYEAPYMLALLIPALAAQSWQIDEIAAYASQHTWMLCSAPFGFLVAFIGLTGKLELPPFDAPEAEQEIVGGSLVEYSGRGLALFRIAKSVEMLVGLALISAFYLGGIGSPLSFLGKTIGLLIVMALIQSTMTRLRIDQTVGMWWQIGGILALLQLLFTILARIA